MSACYNQSLYRYITCMLTYISLWELEIHISLLLSMSLVLATWIIYVHNCDSDLLLIYDNNIKGVYLLLFDKY